MNQLFISVVICTLNRSSDLLRVLRYFASEPYRPFEVIVVDQSDQIDPAVSSFLIDHQFQVIRRSEKSLPKSRNAGIAAARGEIIIFVDDDVEIVPGFLAAHAETFADERVWGATGAVLNPGSDGAEAPSLSGEVEWVPGCNMAIRCSALEHVGEFDEMFEIICDDAEMSHRLRMAGGKLIYNPSARLIHHQRKDGGTRFDAVASAAYVRKYSRSVAFFNLLLTKDHSRRTNALAIFRRMIFSRSSYCLGRVGIRQIAAFFQGILAARREFQLRMKKVTGKL